MNNLSIMSLLTTLVRYSVRKVASDFSICPTTHRPCCSTSGTESQYSYKNKCISYTKNTVKMLCVNDVLPGHSLVDVVSAVGRAVT